MFDKLFRVMESPAGDAISTASKVAGAASGTIGVSGYVMAIPWSEITLIVSCVGAVFFAIERAVHCVIYLKKVKNGDSNAD